MRAGKYLPFVEVRLNELPDGVPEPLAPEPLLDVGEAPADATLAGWNLDACSIILTYSDFQKFYISLWLLHTNSVAR